MLQNKCSTNCEEKGKCLNETLPLPTLVTEHKLVTINVNNAEIPAILMDIDGNKSCGPNSIQYIYFTSGKNKIEYNKIQSIKVKNSC